MQGENASVSTAPNSPFSVSFVVRWRGKKHSWPKFNLKKVYFQNSTRDVGAAYLTTIKMSDKVFKSFASIFKYSATPILTLLKLKYIRYICWNFTIFEHTTPWMFFHYLTQLSKVSCTMDSMEDALLEKNLSG